MQPARGLHDWDGGEAVGIEGRKQHGGWPRGPRPRLDLAL
jgi:hypothetical protein